MQKGDATFNFQMCRLRKSAICWTSHPGAQQQVPLFVHHLIWVRRSCSDKSINKNITCSEDVMGHS